MQSYQASTIMFYEVILQFKLGMNTQDQKHLVKHHC